MDIASLRIASAASITSKPSEDETSVDKLVAPEAEGTASAVAVKADVVASSDTAKFAWDKIVFFIFLKCYEEMLL